MAHPASLISIATATLTWFPNRGSRAGRTPLAGRFTWISSIICSTEEHNNQTLMGTRKDMLPHENDDLSECFPRRAASIVPGGSDAGIFHKGKCHAGAGTAACAPREPALFHGRYEAPDGSLRAIYLTGSHTWGNLCDTATARPAFDYAAYLDFLQRYHHNFIRLWSGDGLGHKPVPYMRSGPGMAKDGGLKVDLDRFDPAFFDRLRSRVVAARDRGVYVGIMLFSPDSGAKREDWNELLYHPANNVQGINADTNGDGRGRGLRSVDSPDHRLSGGVCAKGRRYSQRSGQRAL